MHSQEIRTRIKKNYSCSLAIIFFYACFFFSLRVVNANVVSKFDDDYSLKNYDFNLPAEYNSANYGLVTSVKTQGNQGPCWAFGIISALESNYLKQNNLKIDPNWEIDFSEMNMIFNLNSGASLNNLYEFDFTSSGNDEMASAYFASGRGPVFEKDDIYNPDYSPRDQEVNLNRPLAKYIRKIIFIPDPDKYDVISLKNHRELIKKYVFENGSVASDIFFDKDFLDVSGQNYFYNSYASRINHTIAIVGWDDNYPRENFNKNNLPDSNGAFIVKNSWGPNKHDNGFFYLSYDDKFAGFNSLVMQDIVNPDYKFRFSNIYQHDYFGMTYAIKKDLIDNKDSVASVFDLRTNPEALTDVGIFIASNNTNCKIYLLEVDEDSNIQGYSDFLCETCFELPGYYVISLPDKVLLDRKKFGVAINLTGEKLFIPCEKRIYDYSSKAIGYPGQNFYGDQYGFYDLYDKIDGITNFCIKAFTEKNISNAKTISYNKIKPVASTDDCVSQIDDIKDGNKIGIEEEALDFKPNVSPNPSDSIINELPDRDNDNLLQDSTEKFNYLFTLLPFIGLAASYFLHNKIN